MQGSSPPLAASNPALKRLRRLVRDPSLRRSQGCYVAEGPHVVGDLLDAGALVEAVYVDADRLDPDPAHPRWRWIADLNDEQCRAVRPGVLDQVLDAAQPQGVAAVVQRPVSDLDALVARSPRLVLVLAGLGDPGNVGTLVRSAAAAGADGVVVDPTGADPYGPKAVRASAGALARVTVVEESWEVASAALEAVGLVVWSTDGTAKRTIDEVDLSIPGVVVVGHEARGVPAVAGDAAGVRVRVPMASGVESLNVAMAGTVVLFEAARQRRAANETDGRRLDGRA